MSDDILYCTSDKHNEPCLATCPACEDECPIPIPDFGDDDLYAERLQSWILANGLDEWHPDACSYTIKATAHEIAAHLRDRLPACDYAETPE